jgi:hypothetical protein
MMDKHENVEIAKTKVSTLYQTYKRSLAAIKTGGPPALGNWGAKQEL